MHRIKVRITKMTGRPSLVAQWLDPVTGKLKRKATGKKERREAERFAARLEKELNEGRQADYRTTWQEFRDRYAGEVLAFLSKASQVKANQAFGHVESIVSPRLLVSLDAGELSKLAARLRKDGLEEATVASVLRTLKAALRWAKRLRLIPEAPDITMPPNAEKAGGRAPTAEEFDRLLEEAKKSNAKPEVVASRVRFLLALWWSGLRLNEACRLHWVDDRFITVSLSGKRPMFDIKSEADKGRKDRLFPIAPEFAEMLLAVGTAQREGFVLSWLSDAVKPLGFDDVSRAISSLGRKAKIVVDHSSTGEPVYASAHDLRRSFGTRWAKRVMPPVLKQLMRHASIATTMRFYVDIPAEEAADAAWAAISSEEPAAIGIDLDIKKVARHIAN